MEDLKYAFIDEYTKEVNMSELTKQQVINLQNSIPEYLKEIKEKHISKIELKIEGFELPISGDEFFALYSCSYIIPMWRLENFK